MNSASRREAFVFFLLLAFGIVGRWAQPEWNFTPLAAVTAMGAYYFRGWLPAVLLPVCLLSLSDLLLLPHDSVQHVKTSIVLDTLKSFSGVPIPQRTKG